MENILLVLGSFLGILGYILARVNLRLSILIPIYILYSPYFIPALYEVSHCLLH